MSEITKALIEFHRSVDKIDKNARGNYGKFADLANVLSTITPPLLANGLVLTQTFEEDCLTTTLRHVSGETIDSTTMLIVAEGRNKTQEWGKAVTYQRRYAACAILGLVADMDVDAEATPEPPAKPTAKPAAKPAPAPVAAFDNEEPLSPDERNMVLSLVADKMGTLKPKESQIWIEDLTKAFYAEFPDQADSARLSDAIQTQTHAAFVNVFLNS
jgi:hypothetical protein